MSRKLACTLMMLATLAACGAEPEGVPKNVDQGSGGDSRVRFDANRHTPGFFRDLYRMLMAQSVVDDATAVERMLVDLPQRLASTGELPDMLESDVRTAEGLMILALRGVQATQTTPKMARQIGERLLTDVLALDPARVAWNREHEPIDHVEVITGGPAALARAAAFALDHAARIIGAVCEVQHTSQAAAWDAGEAQTVWVDEVCQPDRYVGGYCEPDRYIEGECYEDWVPENCGGGYWKDMGYYEYRCYDDDDCRYIWRSRWIYFEGTCTGGYYEEDCYSGYWERGICYEGTFVPGVCQPGHYEYRFPGGTWTFEMHATAPSECAPVRPTQWAIGVTAVQVLKAKVYADMEPEWQAALDDLLASEHVQQPSEGLLDAVRQIIKAIGE